MAPIFSRISPRILATGWGKMEIEGIGSGKDFKLWPGGGRAWDWGETGTDHSAGIQTGDVDELVENGCTIIILTRGVFSRLKVPSEVISYLESRGIEPVVTDTKRGVSVYNDYVQKNIPVGGLFHSTC
jgi:hypothetical protein